MMKYKRLGEDSLLKEYVEYVQSQVADIRNNVNVPPEIDYAVRRGICEVLDTYFKTKLNQIGKENTVAKESFK